MTYAFLLFWPSNVISPWLMISLLQFFIPLNLFFRRFCSGITFYKLHLISGLVILVGVSLSMI